MRKQRLQRELWMGRERGGREAERGDGDGDGDEVSEAEAEALGRVERVQYLVNAMVFEGE
jgi:hypothetical protein